LRVVYDEIRRFNNMIKTGSAYQRCNQRPSSQTHLLGYGIQSDQLADGGFMIAPAALQANVSPSKKDQMFEVLRP
jgi:hypothetical protein